MGQIKNKKGDEWQRPDSGKPERATPPIDDSPKSL